MSGTDDATATTTMTTTTTIMRRDGNVLMGRIACGWHMFHLTASQSPLRLVRANSNRSARFVDVTQCGRAEVFVGKIYTYIHR